MTFSILNSEGAFIQAGYEIANIVFDAELNKHVDNVCENAFATVLQLAKNGLWN